MGAFDVVDSGPSEQVPGDAADAGSGDGGARIVDQLLHLHRADGQPVRRPQRPADARRRQRKVLEGQQAARDVLLVEEVNLTPRNPTSQLKSGARSSSTIVEQQKRQRERFTETIFTDRNDNGRP